MKLVIHCGLHKTATTSFQNFCSENRDRLHSFGIHYPMLDDHSQHSYLLHDCQRTDLEVVGRFFYKAFIEAQANCHTVLISGEDFENCIVDLALASEIEAKAYAAGFLSIVWIVVTRPVPDLVESLYAEMSRHGVVLDRGAMQHATQERGCIYVSSAQYNYIFVLNFSRFSERFSQGVSGQVVTYNYEDFVRGYPGKPVFRYLLMDDEFLKFEQLAKFDSKIQNQRLGSWQVEERYLATAPGLRLVGWSPFRLLLVPFVWRRLRKANRFRQNPPGRSKN